MESWIAGGPRRSTITLTGVPEAGGPVPGPVDANGGSTPNVTGGLIESTGSVETLQTGVLFEIVTTVT